MSKHTESAKKHLQDARADIFREVVDETNPLLEVISEIIDVIQSQLNLAEMLIMVHEREQDNG